MVMLLSLAGCDDDPDLGPSSSPSDDPSHYTVPDKAYTPVLSKPVWVVPGDNLPAGVVPAAANNNVEIIFFNGRLFMAWRTNKTHFASADVKMYVVSSDDLGKTWRFEHEIAIGTDVREPRFVGIKGRLLLYYVKLGKIPTAFTPLGVYRIEYLGPGSWSPPVQTADANEVLWRLKKRNGLVWMTSYRGLDYGPSAGELEVLFQRSSDGLTFEPLGGDGVVYKGGVSEVAFEFDETGALWAVTRNEDGDASGFGSHLCTAKAGDLGNWDCPKKSDPYRYDSPWMIRHGRDLYLVARRDPNGPFDQGDDALPFEQRKAKYLSAYSTSTKRTALYKIDRDNKKVVHLLDLPSAGDNAFPSVRRLDAHRFLIANYTSPLEMTEASWIDGQIAQQGTQLYFIMLTFEPQ
ncbi:MAG: hypothetical protein KC503_39220 [Myxococcales bacterium]|nr:hypothetical protein [Myxococcales bacterium]